VTFTALAKATTKFFISGIVCEGWGEENYNPSPFYTASQLLGGRGSLKAKLQKIYSSLILFFKHFL
jgi:hypothetical protein